MLAARLSQCCQWILITGNGKFLFLFSSEILEKYRLPVGIHVCDTKMHKTFTGYVVLSAGGTSSHY